MATFTFESQASGIRFIPKHMSTDQVPDLSSFFDDILGSDFLLLSSGVEGAFSLSDISPLLSFDNFKDL